MKFKKIILKNGLTILHEKRDVPVTSVFLACKYGALYETEDEKGIAHFIEHLCFKGTKKRTTREISFEIEKLGGDLNAFTHENLTAYHVKLSSNHLKTAIDVLFDLYFNPIFPEEEVKKEAKVICEEIKMYRDNPKSYVLDKIKENLFSKPFGMFIAGNEKNVLSFDRGFLLKKHRSIYCPENTILCVVGNNDFEEIVSLAKKYSEEIDFRKFVKPSLPNFKLKNLISKEKRKNIEQTNIAIGFHFPHVNSKLRFAAEIFDNILGQGMSSKLFTEVREKRGLAYTVRSHLDLGLDYGYLLIYIGTESGKEKQVIDLCLEEFKKMKNISDEELRHAKEQLIGKKTVSEEDSSEAALTLILETMFSDSKNYYDYYKKINSVRLEEVKSLANIKEYSVFYLSPDK